MLKQNKRDGMTDNLRPEGCLQEIIKDMAATIKPMLPFPFNIYPLLWDNREVIKRWLVKNKQKIQQL